MPPTPPPNIMLKMSIGELKPSSSASTSSLLNRFLASLVIYFSLLWVRQNLISVRDFFELVSSVGVLVRVELHSKFSVGLLQLRLTRFRFYLKNVIVFCLLHHFASLVEVNQAIK